MWGISTNTASPHGRFKKQLFALLQLHLNKYNHEYKATITTTRNFRCYEI